MPIILVSTVFTFAVDGNHVVEYGPGEHDVSERCALVAVEHLGVASWVKGIKVSAPVVTPVIDDTPPIAPPADGAGQQSAVDDSTNTTPKAVVTPPPAPATRLASSAKPKPPAKPKTPAKPAAKPKPVAKAKA